VTPGYAKPRSELPWLPYRTTDKVFVINSHNFGGATDPDALAYIAAVEAADGATLAAKYRDAINNFVVGAKADGFWSAIKAACFLAGPATLAGALVPLVGSAPTNFNFVSGDYNQATGLAGNGSNKRLGTNYSYTSGMQNNCHAAAYQVGGVSTGVHFGAINASFAGTFISSLAAKASRHYSIGTVTFSPSSPATSGFHGVSRSAASFYSYRSSAGTETASLASTEITLPQFSVFARSINVSFDNFSSIRQSFYSFGDALDLELLQARLDTYMVEIA
jgi:hypothetical protein